MQRPVAAVVGGIVGAFFGAPQLGFALGGLVGGRAPADRFNNAENFKGGTLPPYGSRKVAGGTVWGEADALQDGYTRFAPMCTQCGAPHEQHTTACGYCLTPRGGNGGTEWIEVTALGDTERRYVPGPSTVYR